jgi:hypothetical protein
MDSAALHVRARWQKLRAREKRICSAHKKQGLLGGVVRMPNLPFDLATVDWVTVAIYSGIAFIAAVLGNAIGGNRLLGAIISTILFAVFFVCWHYWLAGMVLPGAAPAPV